MKGYCRKRFLWLFVLFLLPGTSWGGVITLDAISRGWINVTGEKTNPSGPATNYFAGNQKGVGEFRNFFIFNIPLLSEPVVSARLILSSAMIQLLQGPSITYSATSLPGIFSFADLGYGDFYGSRTYSTSDSYKTSDIALNSAALGDIISLSAFGIGGRIANGAIFGPGYEKQFVFGASGIADYTARLEITTGVQVPEAAFLLLVGIGMTAVGMAAWARKMQRCFHKSR